MNMSPAVRKILNLLSSIIHAAFDALIYQLILSVMLLILSESAPAEARIFASGVIIVCFAARSLYGFESTHVLLDTNKFRLFHY